MIYLLIFFPVNHLAQKVSLQLKLDSKLIEIRRLNVKLEMDNID